MPNKIYTQSCSVAWRYREDASVYLLNNQKKSVASETNFSWIQWICNFWSLRICSSTACFSPQTFSAPFSFCVLQHFSVSVLKTDRSDTAARSDRTEGARCRSLSRKPWPHCILSHGTFVCCKILSVSSLFVHLEKKNSNKKCTGGLERTHLTLKLEAAAFWINSQTEVLSQNLYRRRENNLSRPESHIQTLHSTLNYSSAMTLLFVYIWSLITAVISLDPALQSTL